MKKNMLLIWISILVVIIWLITFLIIFKTNPSDKEILSCEDSVKLVIKSPYSATFSEMKYKKWTSHFVIGIIDSQNSFGAMMRSKFICVKSLNEINYRVFFDNTEDIQEQQIYDSRIKLSKYF